MKNVVRNEYFQLVRRFPLRPIRSGQELDKATWVIDELIAQEHRSDEAADYLDVLSDLIEKYESEHHPIPDASPVEVLQFLIEDRKTNQRAVALGSGMHVSTTSEILSGLRQMNLDHMRKLAAFFNVDIAVFLPARQEVPSQARPAAKRRTTVPKRAAAKR